MTSVTCNTLDLVVLTSGMAINAGAIGRPNGKFAALEDKMGFLLHADEILRDLQHGCQDQVAHCHAPCVDRSLQA